MVIMITLLTPLGGARVTGEGGESESLSVYNIQQ